MTGPIRNPHVQKLLNLSARDESVLILPLPDSIFGFHAQQSCEKLMKALLSARNVSFPLTHSLTILTDKLLLNGESLPALPHDLLRLEPFAVQLRYEEGDLLGGTAKAAIRASVAILREHVLGRIEALERG